MTVDRTSGPNGDVAYHVESAAPVVIQVKAGSDAITRVTGPDGDDWRAHLYPLYAEQDVLNMWADNALRNGVDDASRLDGWADLAPGEVTMRVGI